jgi:uncharacterized protein YdhG (YjbR/CyaY superfamily)
MIVSQGECFLYAAARGKSMQNRQPRFSTIDEYIAMFSEDIRVKLESLRATIRASAPEAQEKISYQMPTFYLNGNLVHFAALKSHIGFYPTSSGIAAFQDELSEYEGTKGAVRFPINQPIPMDLISRIVKFRVSENLARAAAKLGKSKG